MNSEEKELKKKWKRTGWCCVHKDLISSKWWNKERRKRWLNGIEEKKKRFLVKKRKEKRLWREMNERGWSENR